MNSLIVYGTKYGCTEKCANLLSEKIYDSVDLCNIKTAKELDLDRYDQVIIGGAIYMGKVQKEVSQFCLANLSILEEKGIGLFICGMLKDNAEKQLNNSFPPELLTKAVAKEFLGGEFKFKKLNPMERFMVKMVSKSDQNLPALDINNDISTLSQEIINNFADAINNASS